MFDKAGAIIYDVDDMDGITQGVIGNGIWAVVAAAARRLFRRQIKITYPRSGEALQGREPQGQGFTYPVRGTLGHRRTGHEIWLLTQDEMTGNVWPQGATPVQYDPHTRAWEGRVHWNAGANLKIIAVVAPPTSQDYFRYFQKLGTMRHWQYEPLPRVPPECVNFDAVQARVLKSL
jgi:hypothetical protein